MWRGSGILRPNHAAALMLQTGLPGRCRGSRRKRNSHWYWIFQASQKTSVTCLTLFSYCRCKQWLTSETWVIQKYRLGYFDPISFSYPSPWLQHQKISNDYFGNEPISFLHPFCLPNLSTLQRLVFGNFCFQSKCVFHTF